MEFPQDKEVGTSVLTQSQHYRGQYFNLIDLIFLIPANDFEIGYVMVNIEEFIFRQDTSVTIT